MGRQLHLLRTDRLRCPLLRAAPTPQNKPHRPPQDLLSPQDKACQLTARLLVLTATGSSPLFQPLLTRLWNLLLHGRVLVPPKVYLNQKNIQMVQFVGVCRQLQMNQLICEMRLKIQIGEKLWMKNMMLS